MTSNPLATINTRGLTAAAADSIREAIMRGTFAPGETLREGPLAESLGVSRGSVREGLAILEREGIIQTGWHRPAVVVSVTRARARDLYQLRAGLDRIAAQNAAGKAKEANFEEELAGLAAALESSHDPSELVIADLAFHDVVYRIADNEPLTAAWHAIRSQIRLYQLLRIRRPEPGYNSGLLAEHAEYARILARGDADTAAGYAVRHIEAALAALVDRLEN